MKKDNIIQKIFGNESKYEMVFHIILSIIVIVGFVGFVRFYISSSFEKMGISFQHISSVFVLVGGLFIFFLFIKYVFQENFPKIKEILKKKFNVWVILTICLIIFVILSGMGLISEEYKSKLPLNAKYKLYDDTNKIELPKISLIYCESKSGYTDFVKGDIIDCGFTINYTNAPNLNLSYIEVRQYLFSNNTLNTIYEVEWASPHQKKNAHPRIDLNKNKEENYADITIYVEFRSKTRSYTGYYYKIKSPILQKEEYDAREKQKISLILALLSFASFSIIIGVKNFRDLVNGR